MKHLSSYTISFEKKPIMQKYTITLNFSFNKNDVDDDELSEYEQSKKEAFARTDAYYEKNSLEQYIKSMDAYDMVEFIGCDREIHSAEWDVEKFAIHLVIETDQDKEEILKEYKMNSLEDGEYEGCGDSGWILFTRGPEGEVYDCGEQSWDAWEYGLLDYRQNPIEITKATEE